MTLLEDKGRDYRRFRPSPEERTYLAERGLRWVLSSNVSAIGTQGDDLVIRFHNGSVYAYIGQADKVDDIFKSNSKGRWVWRHLRRKGVPYKKIGAISLPDDIKVSDEAIMSIGKRPASTFDLLIGQRTAFDLLLDNLPGINTITNILN